jgi:predicted transcriptional regulator
MIPAFATALQDPVLRGHARDVYIWLHEHLDVVQFRPVKHIEIEQDLQVNSMAVGRSIDRLIECGYIDRGAREGRVWTYRLFYSRPSLSSKMLPEVPLE